MTWTVAIMPDDALPPDSLVGSMLNPEPKFTAEEIEMITAPWSYLEPLPLCLWQVLAPILDDYICEALRATDDPDAEQKPEYPACRQEVSDAIEALRDWLLPEELEPSPAAPDDGIPTAKWLRWSERQSLRALLTEQAHIAREGKSDG